MRIGSRGKQRYAGKSPEKASSLVDAASWLQLAEDFDKLAEREQARLRCKRHHALERQLAKLKPS